MCFRLTLECELWIIEEELVMILHHEGTGGDGGNAYSGEERRLSGVGCTSEGYHGQAPGGSVSCSRGSIWGRSAGCARRGGRRHVQLKTRRKRTLSARIARRSVGWSGILGAEG